MPLSVCIVSPSAYGAMRGGSSGQIGGIQWQTSLLAKWLAQKGHPTSILTWDEGGPTEECVDGVRIIKICPQDSGLRGLRFFHPKWTGLVRAMRRANADIYYQNGAECTTGQVGLWCRSNRRPFVFSVASDGDCVARRQLVKAKGLLPTLLYVNGLVRADHRIVQTESQRRRIRDLFGVDSAVIPMPCPGPAEWTARTHAPNRRILWVGRICGVKRPHLLLSLAESCPDLTFDIVGPVYSDAYAQRVHEHAKRIPNIALHGAVSRNRVGAFYRDAACLCCTSEYEGFPNTFLEAWSHGLPVVSTFDPDSLITTRKLGIAADVPALRAAVRLLVESPATYAQMAQNGRQYFLENHRLEIVLPRFQQVFARVANRDSAARPEALNQPDT